MEKFPDCYERRLVALDFEPAFDLDAALQTARLITGRQDDWAYIDDRESDDDEELPAGRPADSI